MSYHNDFCVGDAHDDNDQSNRRRRYGYYKPRSRCSSRLQEDIQPPPYAEVQAMAPPSYTPNTLKASSYSSHPDAETWRSDGRSADANHDKRYGKHDEDRGRERRGASNGRSWGWGRGGRGRGRGRWRPPSRNRKTDGPNDAMQRLQVTMRLAKCFHDENEVKEAIKTLLELPANGKIKLVFQNFVQLYQKNTSVCYFTVYETTTRGFYSRPVYDSELNIIKAKLGGSIGQLQEQLSTTVDMQIEFLSQGSRSMESRLSLMRPPEPIPQTLVLSVGKGFKTPALFMQFVKLSLSGTDDYFQIDQQTISVSESSCKCLIHTDSKAVATRLKKAFQKVGEIENVPIQCSQNLTKDDQDKHAKRNSLLEDALADMKMMTDESLQHHVNKISSYQKELLSMQDAINSGNLTAVQSAFVSAVDNKISLLNDQKSEFLSQCNLLEEGIKKNDSNDLDEKDITVFLESVKAECHHLVKAYPVYGKRKAILSLIEHNQMCVLSGDTGSGISTQLVQYLFEAHYADKDNVIVCCQPKNTLAISLAEKVAKELPKSFGDVVGYKTTTVSKFQDGKTKIVFTTYDLLLNECVENPVLKGYICIILDDALCQCADKDALMLFLKERRHEDDDLRLIVSQISSSTQTRQRYKKEINIHGEQFPVEMYHEEDVPDTFENYEMKAVSKAADIHSSGASGDILVFLSTSLEIMRCCREFQRIFQGNTDFKCLTLHDHTPREEMSKVFDKVPVGVRRVIFATDIAERFMAVGNVKFVIDTGITLQKSFHGTKNIWISSHRAICKCSAEKRKHLVGWSPKGKCYRLYSKNDFDSFQKEYDVVPFNALYQARFLLKEKELKVSYLGQYQGPGLQLLERLQGLHKGELTEAGLWMSRLPFDVANNILIYKAKTHNLIYETILLATLMFYDCEISLFYQDLSQQESCDLSENKEILASQFGDIFSLLNIFKTWILLTKDTKVVWCRQNNLNYKALGFVRNCIDETVGILNKQLGIVVHRKFTNNDSDLDILRKMIFDIHIESVSQFVDDNGVGYKPLVSHQCLSIHPDSNLTKSKIYPEWIVFTSLVRTSKEKIKGIVVVEEEWVYDAVASGRIKLNITSQEMPLVYHGEFGSISLKHLIGPCFENLWSLGDDMSKATGVNNSVEANKIVGTLNVYSKSPFPVDLVNDLDKAKENIQKALQNEEKVFSLNVFSPGECKNGKVVIGQGGNLKHLVHTKRSNLVLLKQTTKYATISDVVDKFEHYGQVIEVTKFIDQKAWGTILFGSISEALCAARGVMMDKHYTVEIIENETNCEVANMFQLRASWLKPSQMDCRYAVIKCSALERSVLFGRVLELSGNMCEITASSANSRDLVIMNIVGVTEEIITSKLTQELEAFECTSTHFKVSLHTYYDQEETIAQETGFESPKEILKMIMKKHVKESDCYIRQPYVCQSNTRNVCFIEFSDPTEVENVCGKINRRYKIGGEEIDFKPLYSTNLRVPKIVKEACQKQLSRTFDLFHLNHNELDVMWRQDGEDMFIDINSSSLKVMVDVRERSISTLEGEVIESSCYLDAYSLLQVWGQNRLATIQQNTDCTALTDFRQARIHLYGSPKDIQYAKNEINAYLSTSEDTQEREVDLKYPGLMRSVLQNYGSGLESLVEEHGLKSCKLNMTNQSICLVGSAVAVDETCCRLKELQDEAKKIQMKEGSDFPDCSVCKGSTNEGLLYRLEMCGHAYCFPCFQGLTKVGFESKELPIKCIICDAILVVRDFGFLLGKGLVTEKSLVSTAIQVSVSTETSFAFCLSLNCPMVYEKTQKTMGSEFVCPICFASMCTTCHKPFHRGMSCQQAIKPKVTLTQFTDALSPGKSTEEEECGSCDIGFHAEK